MHMEVSEMGYKMWLKQVNVVCFLDNKFERNYQDKLRLWVLNK